MEEKVNIKKHCFLFIFFLSDVQLGTWHVQLLKMNEFQICDVAGDNEDLIGSSSLFDGILMIFN